MDLSYNSPTARFCFVEKLVFFFVFFEFESSTNSSSSSGEFVLDLNSKKVEI